MKNSMKNVISDKANSAVEGGGRNRRGFPVTGVITAHAVYFRIFNFKIIRSVIRKKSTYKRNVKDWDVLKARALPAHQIVEGFGNL